MKKLNSRRIACSKQKSPLGLNISKGISPFSAVKTVFIALTTVFIALKSDFIPDEPDNPGR
ncbi:MAG: hypothetical protein J6K31_14485 [Parabacteroides sp.]|nr:hypothetical protein [Parabacteroides sp.]